MFGHIPEAPVANAVKCSLWRVGTNHYSLVLPCFNADSCRRPRDTPFPDGCAAARHVNGRNHAQRHARRTLGRHTGSWKSREHRRPSCGPGSPGSIMASRQPKAGDAGWRGAVNGLRHCSGIHWMSTQHVDTRRTSFTPSRWLEYGAVPFAYVLD